jgi:hypothetical protein
MIFGSETTIVPLTHTTVKTITSFKISRINITDVCTVEVHSFDSDNHIVNIDLIVLTSEEYALWGTDDSYILSVAAHKLGYVNQ